MREIIPFVYSSRFRLLRETHMRPPHERWSSNVTHGSSSLAVRCQNRPQKGMTDAYSRHKQAVSESKRNDCDPSMHRTAGNMIALGFSSKCGRSTNRQPKGQNAIKNKPTREHVHTARSRRMKTKHKHHYYHTFIPAYLI